MWDLRCKRHAVTLRAVLGAARDTIPIHTTAPSSWSTDDITDAQKQGFVGFQVRVGNSIHDEAARLAAFRKGNHVFPISADVYRPLTVVEALKATQALESYDLAWLLEPLSVDDITGYEKLSNNLKVPICVGKSLYSLNQFRQFLQRGLCTLIQVDADRIGGISAWLKVAHLAECFNVPMVTSTIPLLHASLACITPNARSIELHGFIGNLSNTLHVENGHAIPPEGAGIGIELDVSLLAEMKTLVWENGVKAVVETAKVVEPPSHESPFDKTNQHHP